MCGRYCISTAPEAIRRLFRYVDQPNFPPRYNLAPTQPVPIVRLVQGVRRFALVRWGLLPSWVEDPKTFSLLINARGETVNDKPAFRSAMRRRRCLFPADGFYEWKEEGGKRRSYYARLRGGGPMAFAGLWETWTGPNGEEMETAVIVTTKANRTLGAIHDRAPVIVPPEAFDLWLDCDKVDEKTATALFAPAPEAMVEVYEVSPAVNRVANDSPELTEPFSADAAAAAPAAESKPEARPKRRRNMGQGSLF